MGLGHIPQKVKDFREIPGDNLASLCVRTERSAEGSQLAYNSNLGRDLLAVSALILCNPSEFSRYTSLSRQISQAFPLRFLPPVFTSLLHPEDDIKSAHHFLLVSHGLVLFFPLIFSVHLKFILVAGQGWGQELM